MSTWLLTLGFLTLAGVGVVLPALIHRGLIVSRPWSRILALIILLSVAGLITLLVYLTWHYDPGAIFTRVFLVDGISLYILNNAPAPTKKEQK